VLQGADGSDTMAKFVNDGAAELYYDNSKKIETTATGIDVTGTVTSDGLGVSGLVTLDDYSGNSGRGRISIGNSGQQYIEGYDTGNAGSGSYLSFGQGASERMRIDSSGILLVGATSSNSANVGHGFNSNGFTYHTRDGGEVLRVNRKSSDGSIISLHKDGSVVGSIGTSFGDITIGGKSGLRFDTDSSQYVIPYNVTDNAHTTAIDLGTSDRRFKDLYLSGGVYLGGTTAANKLDDYETGTWTPAFVSTTVDPTVSYNQRFGRYTKIGNTVYVYLYIKVTTASGGSGNVNITGLPFNNSSNSPISEGNSFQFNFYQNTNLSSGRVLAGYFRNNDNKIYCVANGGGNSTSVYTVPELTTNNNLVVYGSGTYTVSS
jgi:hypothetical protein